MKLVHLMASPLIVIELAGLVFAAADTATQARRQARLRAAHAAREGVGPRQVEFSLADITCQQRPLFLTLPGSCAIFGAGVVLVIIGFARRDKDATP